VRLLALCCGVLSVWAATAAGRGPNRVQRLLARRPAPPPRQRVMTSPIGRGAVCVLGLAVLGWVVVGPVGALVGGPAGLALSSWLGRLESPEAAQARAEIDRDLPLALDLLAACAAAGRPPQQALSVVGRALGGSLGARFEEVTSALSMGGDPSTEWARLLSHAQLGGLARVMQRSAESGAPLADGLARLADDHRRERRTRSLMRARTVGVRVAGPLAGCFLPAFMLIGVVPTVAGSFQHLFG
jgi:Flp pilus assembly protein TadB